MSETESVVLNFLKFISAPSIVNSFVIVLFLSGMMAMILMRTLHKDLARYNQELSVCERFWKKKSCSALLIRASLCSLGGRSGRIRLEAGARRRLSTSVARHASVRHGRKRSSNWNDWADCYT